MKHRFLCIAIVLCLLPVPVFTDAGPDLQALFDQGVAAYEEERFADALSFFLEAREQGVHAKLLYNIGNTYYKLKDFLMAKVYYLKARKLDPANPQIQTNISVVNKKFRDQVNTPRGDFIRQVLWRLESALPLRFLASLLFFLVLILNAFIFLLLLRGKRKWLMYAVSFTLVFLLLFLGYFLHRVHRIEKSDSAVVQVEKAGLRSGPGAHNTVLYHVHRGLAVTVVNRSQEWVYVSAGSEISGWIPHDALIFI